jgi:MFS transporter, FHS family, glucose/mannose:H+ symporter
LTLRELIRQNAALLITGILTFILMGAGQSLYGPALPAYARDFGLSLGAAGLLVSAHWVGCALGVGSMFALGAKVTPRVTVVIMALGAGLLATGFSWAVTLLGGLVFGAGYGCATVVFNPRMLKAFGARGPAMVSLLNATFGIGAIGSPLVFVAMGNNPLPTFAFCTLLALGIAVFAGAAGRGGAVVAQAQSEGFRLHWPVLGFAVIAIALEATLIGLGPAALIKAGESETHAAQLLSAFFLAFLAARLGLSFVAHLLPAFTLFTLAMLGASLSALACAMLPPSAGFVTMGFFAGMFFPSEYVTASRKMGDHPRVAPAIIAAGLVGGVLAPLLVSPFLGELGARGFFWLAAGVSGAVALVALASLRAMNR